MTDKDCLRAIASMNTEVKEALFMVLEETIRQSREVMDEANTMDDFRKMQGAIAAARDFKVYIETAKDNYRMIEEEEKTHGV